MARSAKKAAKKAVKASRTPARRATKSATRERRTVVETVKPGWNDISKKPRVQKNTETGAYRHKAKAKRGKEPPRGWVEGLPEGFTPSV